MSSKFDPEFGITPAVANALVRIEAVKQNIKGLPLTPIVIEKLRETARLQTVHYSTKIEGNLLTKEQVVEVVKENKSFVGRERDEKEIKGCYAALDAMEKYVARGEPVTERVIQTLHALLMSGGRTKVKPTPYRDGQNVIREGATGAIVYMPPEAKDVPALMKSLVFWIKKSADLPCPIIAAIAHYQFATIHPYYDGNGRTARLLTTVILHLCGYDLQGIYSLDQYYADDLPAYYQALSVGPSHNYYMGRAESDITQWIEYFCEGMAQAFENVHAVAQKYANKDKVNIYKIIRTLDTKQRKVIELFRSFDVITSAQVGEILGFKQRTARQLCKKWVDSGFVVIVDPSKKGRKYALAPQFIALLD